MGLLEFGANVLMRLKADTSDAKAKLKDLTEQERKAAEAAIKLTDAENKRLEKKSKNWQFAAQAVGGLVAAYAVGKKGLEAYAKTSSAAGTEVRLLQEKTSKAFDSLNASIGKVVMSMEPLISGVSKLVSKLAEVGVAGPAAIGALALAVTGNPVIAGIIGGAAWAAGGDYGSGDLIGPDGSIGIGRGMLNVRNKKIAARKAEEARLADAAKTSLYRAGSTVFGASGAGLTTGSGLSNRARLIVVDKKAGTVQVELLDPDEVQTYGLRRNIANGNASTALGVSADSYGVAANAEKTAIDRIMDQQTRAFRAGSAGLMSPYAAQGSGIAGAQESQLSRMFGPISEFNAYATAFDTLGGAIGSALGAWIDGSMSAGKAFKAFIAEAVKGLAVQMTIEALKHGAYAIGSAAMGNFAGAAMHGKAAAGFAAGAIAASVAAKGLNAGGGGVATPTAPRASGGSSFFAPSQGTAAVIVYGDQFAEDSPHQRQLKARRMVDRALSGRQAVRAA